MRIFLIASAVLGLLVASTPALSQSGGGLSPAIATGLGIPKLKIRGFGHAQFQAERIDTQAEANDWENNFANGGVDLFITSQIAEDISFLNETIFEFGEGGENILDVERVWLKYEYADWLQIGIGRAHTSLGYWNQHYHHGTWLQTTTDRPIAYNFEDEGGILPVHFVGIEASGRVKTGVGAFSYNIAVANGRGDIVDSVQLVEDLNDNKAVMALVRFEPSCLPGLGFGANAYLDEVPDNATPGDGSLPRPSTKERIFGAHLFYIYDKIEAIAEFTAILHEPEGSGARYENYGGYALVAYQLMPRWKPYYRWDFVDTDADDPMFFSLIEDTDRHTAGVRWDLRTFVALKIEYQYADTDSGSSHASIAQASFAF